MATDRRSYRLIERVLASELRAGDVIYFQNGPGLRVRGIEVTADEVRVFTAGLVGPDNTQTSDHRGLIPCPRTVHFTREVR